MVTSITDLGNSFREDYLSRRIGPKPLKSDIELLKEAENLLRENGYKIEKPKSKEELLKEEITELKDKIKNLEAEVYRLKNNYWPPITSPTPWIQHPYYPNIVTCELKDDGVLANGVFSHISNT